MVIIYYTDKDGKITHHQEKPKELTLEVVQERVQEFNGERTDGKAAHVVEAADDGLTAYLFQKAAERKQCDKKMVQDAIDSLEEALDFVRSLR